MADHHKTLPVFQPNDLFAKLRPQFGSVLYWVLILFLLSICPHLTVMWYSARALAWLFPQRVSAMAVEGTIYSFFLRMTLFFFMRMTGVKVYLYGDAKEVLRRNESALYMSNHKSSMDWLVACLLALYAGCLRRLRFVMKQELHWVPMIGFYLQQTGHIFVRRKGFRQDKMMKAVDSLSKWNRPIWIAIFPEGTRYNPDDSRAVAVSQEMARSNNLPVLKHHLSPRPKGSWLLLDSMRPQLQAIYSVTILYQGSVLSRPADRNKAPSLCDVVRGFCSALHVHVKRIPIAEAPQDDASFAPWLHEQFVERDRLLSAYYSTRSLASWGARDLAQPPASLVLPPVIITLLLMLLVVPNSYCWLLYLQVAVVTTVFGWFMFVITDSM